MRRMVCEICKGHDFLKVDGEYVCQGCGTRYLPAEAMRLLADEDHERGTDDGVKELLDHAIQSKNAGHYFEAEYYCNKVLESDPDNYLAWRNKAEAIAKQTSLEDDRTADAISSYREALRFAPYELREDLRKESGDNLRVALMCRSIAACKKFGTTALMPDGDVVLGLPHFVEDRAARIAAATGAKVLDDTIRDVVTVAMHKSSVDAWTNHLLPAYANNEHRDKASMDCFVDGGDQVITIMESAIRFHPGSEECARACYGLMVAVQESLIDAHSMRKSGRKWVRAYSLSDENKESRRRDVAAWRQKLERLGVSDGGTPATKEATAPRRERGSRPDGKPDIMHRTLTWKGLVGFFCISRFLVLISGSSRSDQSIAYAWLLVGVLFMVWWYETS